MNINTEWYFQSTPWPLMVVDLEKKIIFLNKSYEKMYDIQFINAKGKTLREAFNLDRAKEYEEEIDECIKSGKLKNYDAVIDGKYIECKMFPIFDENNKVRGIAGLIVDVTEEKKQQQELQYNRDILRTIIDSLPETIFYKDKNSKFIGCNKHFSDFYKNFGIEEVLGKTDLELYPDKNVAKKFLEDDKEIMESKTAKLSVESRINKEGECIFEESLKVPVIDEEGNVWGIVGLARDITSQKNLEERLRNLSYTDALTGLYNRTCFEEKLQELNKKEYLPLGIIMGDVNGLKLVNDSLGHLQGDKFLKNISEVLSELCNPKGLVFRWGGDEFIILLPNTNEQECENMVNKINDEFKVRKFNDCIDLSIALGETVKYTVEDDSKRLIKEVEERVYRQKLLEKNSVQSSMMYSLKESLEAKNMETEEHTERVEHYAFAIGRKLGLRNSEMDELMIAARLHDIGKIAIDEDILLKPGRLSREEFEIMKTHTEKGYRIINASSELINVARIVLTHHERWDGSGYPLGISYNEIPLMARIISVADSYDVMTHERVYKKAMRKEDAIAELKKCSGTQFDPVVVNSFLEYLIEAE